MIRNIQLKHAGKYVCMVQTSVDKLSVAADLIVRGIQLLFLFLIACFLPFQYLYGMYSTTAT
jgi:hypothetical protein